MDLSELVHHLTVPVTADVKIGVATGDDAGVFSLGGGLNLVVTADFITPMCDDPYLYGQIAAANSISDIYAMGGTPKTAINLCCFPTKGIDKKALVELMQGGLDKVTESGAVLIGGHTVKDNELKYGLSVNGIVRDEDIKSNGGGRPGDLLILTKPVGSGVISSAAKAGALSFDQYKPILEKLAQLNDKACRLMNEFKASGATDITGFGLGGHAMEMAKSSGHGIRFWVDKVPAYQAALDLIARGAKTGITNGNYAAVTGHIDVADNVTRAQLMLYFDPQTSGGLLIAIHPDRAEDLVRHLHDDGVEDAVIVGEVFAAEEPRLELVTH